MNSRWAFILVILMINPGLCRGESLATLSELVRKGVQFSDSPEPEAWVRGLRVLGEDRSTMAVEAVVQAWKSVERETLNKALHVSHLFPDAKVGPSLRDIVHHDTRVDVVSSAVIAIGKREDTESLPLLKDLVLTAENVDIAAAARSAFYRYDELAISYIADIFRSSPDPVTRMWALGFLVRLNVEWAVEEYSKPRYGATPSAERSRRGAFWAREKRLWALRLLSKGMTDLPRRPSRKGWTPPYE